MGKNLKKLIAFVFTATIICSLFSISASATGSAEFYIPDGAVGAGDEFNVSIKFSSDQNIGTVETNLVYDDSVIQFEKGDANGGSGILNIKSFPNEQGESVTVNLTFKGVAKGTAKMSLANCAILSDDGTTLGNPSAYANITVGDSTGATSSSEKESETSTTTTIGTDENGIPVQGVLTSLTVSAGELIPAFSPNIYNYVVKVDNSVEYLEIEGVTASIQDYIWYEGSKYLQVGDTTRTITVTDVNGNKKSYIVIVQRAAAPDTTINETSDENEQQQTKETTKKASNNNLKEEDATDKYKEILMPALGIALFVLVLALAIIVVWLRKKSTQRKEEKETQEEAEREAERAERRRANIKRKK